LFQGRFGSVAMDEAHLMAAARYVARNPVRAGLVARAQDWPWSSVRAHLRGRDDALVSVAPLLERLPRFADLIEGAADEAGYAALRGAETIGRPLGDRAFLEDVAHRLGRSVTPRKRGRKPRSAGAEGSRNREIGA
jgi:REP-associated tyrosine transposase